MSVFSPPDGSDVKFDKVYSLEEANTRHFDAIAVPEFDRYISQYADRIFADYRGADTEHAWRGAPSRPDGPPQQFVGVPGSSVASFDPSTLEDERRKALASKIMRPGQAAFRMKLMQAYGGRCAVTGCDVAAVLEAAHIIPFCGPESDRVCNGLLLRLDLHSLFDRFLMSVDPHSLTLRLSRGLRGGYYEMISGKRLRLPKDQASHPNLDAVDATIKSSSEMNVPAVRRSEPGDGSYGGWSLSSVWRDARAA